MAWGTPPNIPTGKSEIKAKLDELKAAIQQAFDTHRRFWFQTALEGAYAIYVEWKDLGKSKKNAKVAAALFGVKIKDGAHPLSVIIKIVTPTGGGAGWPLAGRAQHGLGSVNCYGELEAKCEAALE